MTTELEEQFYKTFEINPKNKCGKNLIYPNCLNPDKCGYDYCIYCQIEYPEIADRKLLKMICILSAYNYIFEDLKAENIEQLKEEIIKLFFDYPLIAEEEKANIQQLFEGEE